MDVTGEQGSIANFEHINSLWKFKKKQPYEEMQGINTWIQATKDVYLNTNVLWIGSLVLYRSNFLCITVSDAIIITEILHKMVFCKYWSRISIVCFMNESSWYLKTNEFYILSINL